MPEVVIPYLPRKAFKRFHASKKRFRLRVVHRRAGKTHSVINEQIKAALEDPVQQLAERGIHPQNQAEALAWRKIPRMYPIIEPQLKQAKAVAWGPLKFYASKVPGVKINESELSVTFPNQGVVRLFGCGPNEADGFRGQKMWKVEFDEYQDIDPNVWHEIVRPACLDTQAPVGFSGTVKGKNHLWRMNEQYKDDPNWECLWLKASESGILSPVVLAQERADYEKEGKLNKYLQEFELEPMAIIEGAIFGKEYFWLKEHNRIYPFAADEHLQVETYWDLGIADYLVVLFVQRYGMESRIIDCIATHSTSLEEVARMVKAKPYDYSTHYLPHDARARDLSTGKSREEILQGLFNKRGDVRIIDRVRVKEDGISSLRGMHKRLYINEGRKDANGKNPMQDFLDGFAQYEWEFDEDRKVYLPAPKHNWCSHYMDALMGWSQLEMKERPNGPLVHGTNQSTQEDLNSPI